MRTSELLKQADEHALKTVTIATDAPGAQELVITGDFTNWESEGIRFVKTRSGKWQAAFELPPGEYQYRLLIDGVWSDHPEATRRVQNPFGTENCLLVVEE